MEVGSLHMKKRENLEIFGYEEAEFYWAEEANAVMDNLQSRADMFKRKLGELTRAADRKRLHYEMEIYYLNEVIKDFQALCTKNNIDYSIIDTLNKRRRHEK